MSRLGLLLTLLMASLYAAATDPVQFDYMMNCQGCHLPDGAGFPARGVPVIAGNLGNFLRVDGGREFLVQVPGSAQSDLGDAQLAAVLNWMLTTFSAEQLPSDWQPYGAAEVHLLRQSPLIEVGSMRSHLMRLIEVNLQAAGAGP
jgi:mono/diheme cytochrome c family protein